MPRARRHLALVAVLVALAAPSADARADDLARADALFAEGKALLDRGVLPDACTKLDESFKLAPRLGTMLNLGACFERIGRLSRALAMYERAATLAREAGRPDREKLARELAAAVEPRVAKLLVTVESPAPTLTIDVDDQPLAIDAGLVPIDPGERRLTARAPGRVPWSTRISASAGAIVRVRVPPLAPLPPPPAPSPLRLTAEPPAPAPAPRSSPWRTAGIVGGVAIAGVGSAVGTIFGLRALSKRNASSAHCDATGCDAIGRADLDDALTAGNVSTAAFVAAGIGAAAALAVWLFVPATRAGAR